MTTSTQSSQPENIKVLIVDDDPLVLELLSLSINSFGYEYVTAGNGREAMEFMKNHDFTLVITDMIMPEMDGMELLKHIKANYPKTSVIVMTGYTGTFSYMDVIRAGASDFISKPFNSDELEAKISRILREHQLIQELEFLSNCDSLTGLYNRRYFDNKIKEETHRAIRQNYPLFLIMLDVDNFKDYNDLHGHQQGDQVLVTIGTILNNCTRKDVDLLFRYGGDEFTVITPYISHEQITMVGERIIASFADQQIDRVGLSLGIAEFIRTSGTWEEDIRSLFIRADKALYKAKKQGRNQIAFDIPA